MTLPVARNCLEGQRTVEACRNRFVAWLLVGGIYLLAGCGIRTQGWADHRQGLPFVLGYEEGLTAAAEQKKPVMMFVTTTWCGLCKKLAEDNFNDPEVRQLLANFVCVIVDGDEEKSATRKLGSTGYPHLVFLSSTGEKLGEQSGYAPVAAFKPLLKKVLEKSRQGT